MNAFSSTIGSMLGKVGRQGAVVFFTRGAALLLGIISTILLSRLLGTAGLGEFRLGSVLVQLVTAFCVLGLDKALLRYLPVLEARGEKGRGLLVAGSSVVFIISLALSAVLLLTAPIIATAYFHSPAMTSVIPLFSLQVPVLAPVTAEALAGLVLDGTLDPAIVPLGWDRFAPVPARAAE